MTNQRLQFLAGIALLLALPASLLGGPTRVSAATHSAASPSTSQPAGTGLLNLKDNDPNSKLFGAAPPDNTLIWKTLGSMVLVLALGGVALVATKRWFPRLTGRSGRQIRVVETAFLGPRKAVHLLQVGGRKYLVASSKERVSLLTEIGESFQDALTSAEMEDAPALSPLAEGTK